MGEDSALPQYTWEEVAKHNTLESAWVGFEGKVYDITGWDKKHPGGAEYIRVSAGRDITHLLKSYHPFTTKPESILSKKLIGVLSTDELNTFKKDSGFYKEICEEVDLYFKKTGLHHKDPVPGLTRMAGILVVLVLTFLIFNRYFWIGESTTVRVAAAIVYGVAQALILLHMMHDASHSSIGYNETWWYAIGHFTMDFVCGASLMSWIHQHVLGHHVYTNIMGSDPDLPSLMEGDLRYIVPKQVHQALYKYQWVYMPILYGLLAVKVRIQDFTYTFMDESNGAIRVNPLSTLDWSMMIGAKILHVIKALLLPYFMFNMSLLEIIVNYFIVEIATGYFLAYNFQVSHVSTEAAFPHGDEDFKTEIAHEWAVIQVSTGVDYAHDSAIVTFLCGHLNYQIEHHLLPSVSQYHYPAIAPIVQKVCKKWGVPYNYLPTFSEALYLHVKYLYNMGVHQKQGKGESLWH
eukprot:TRINITY_DN11082_c0_g1_i1.p1 TRINITY_DN11082_c0_g1~~TRINITY_DN11082_c0_g1_i1.p1  ORF type:complete len:478 (+),score=110.36 TRINITY_DN11082_c0_g1_i1:49-1434(+)